MASPALDEASDPRCAELAAFAPAARQEMATERAMADADLEITSSVLLDATPEQIFDAYADPTSLARWWGPAGFTSTFHEFDFRPGGRWRFDMHGPSGATYPNENVFVELVRPERIVFDHLGGHRFRMLITLTARGLQTEMVWCMRHETAEQCEKVRRDVLPANEENFDRLGRLLFQQG
jgi:uncharacterized protein YndB with AHSA1/START domain